MDTEETFKWGVPELPYDVTIETFKNFGESVDSVTSKLPSEAVTGDILCVRNGQFFPERLFVCSPESEFTALNPHITSLTCCDTASFSNPELWLDEPVSIERKSLTPPPNTVRFIPVSLQTIAERGPLTPSFDLVMMFRVHPFFNKQFGRIVGIVEPILKPGGIFVGSGSFADKSEVEFLTNQRLLISHVVELPRVGRSFLPFYPKNIGFILKKPS